MSKTDYRSKPDNSAAAPDETVAGRTAVRELLKSSRTVEKIFIKTGERTGSIAEICALAHEKKIPVLEVAPQKLDSMAGGVKHQGIVAKTTPFGYSTLDEILATPSGDKKKLIVIADGVEDPHNLGALLRCADAAGADGVIIPSRRSVGVTAAVIKTSAGAAEHLKIAKVTNLADTVEKLKDAGLWIYACTSGGQAYYETDFDRPAAVILGGEDSGVSRLLLERSDYTVTIPMYGQVNSLNVSTAAAVILCHAARMQRNK